ncbi:vacuolar transporter chaperone [Haplosporangium gracile]|nr:vacuolar transporter chaperone [Haplosporangium gracile]
MDPNDQHHNQHQFTAIELHNQQFTNDNTPVRPRNLSGASNELTSLSSPSSNKQRPASIYSTTGRSKKKQGFWASVKPKKFSFRPDGVKKPKKANSVGNKKAKFSNERTMVHWIKAAMLIGGLAMTLLSFGENQITPYVGVALLVICLMMLIYSTTIFQVRMEWLNMRRKDVIYYDRFAPSILTLFVFLTFAFNGVVIYTGDFHTNKAFLKSY